MRPVADAQAARRSRLHHCAKRGWGGIKNGDILRLAEAEFDLFITSDQNIRYQQNLADRRTALVVADLSGDDLFSAKSPRHPRALRESVWVLLLPP